MRAPKKIKPTQPTTNYRASARLCRDFAHGHGIKFRRRFRVFCRNAAYLTIRRRRALWARHALRRNGRAYGALNAFEIAFPYFASFLTWIR